jgi:hypothetical protein
MTTKFKIIRMVYGQEMNNANGKTYKTKEDATNAGNSWVNDCTVHAEIRKGRYFDVIES